VRGAGRFHRESGGPVTGLTDKGKEGRFHFFLFLVGVERYNERGMGNCQITFLLRWKLFSDVIKAGGKAGNRAGYYERQTRHHCQAEKDIGKTAEGVTFEFHFF
jgi:hypothetical protein